VSEKIKFLDLSLMHEALGTEFNEASLRVIRSNRYLLGAELESFEAEFAQYCGVAYCAGVGSGLDALVLALRALDIGPGDEVIVPGHTFIATWLAVTMVGANIVPVDVDEQTWCIDPEQVSDVHSVVRIDENQWITVRDLPLLVERMTDPWNYYKKEVLWYSSDDTPYCSELTDGGQIKSCTSWGTVPQYYQWRDVQNKPNTVFVHYMDDDGDLALVPNFRGAPPIDWKPLGDCPEIWEPVCFQQDPDDSADPPGQPGQCEPPIE